MSLGFYGAQGFFVTPLPNERTRVELSSSFGAPDKFFARLKELIVVFEKKAEIIKERKRGIEIDRDLRNVYRIGVPKEKTQKAPEPAPAPARHVPQGRIHRSRRRMRKR